MATIIESNPTENDGAMKMSAEFTFSDGQCEYVLASGSTGYTCHGTFSAMGVPDGTKLSFPESESQLLISQDSGRQLEGTLGVSVFNKDGMMTEKGHIIMIWTYQDGARGQIVANFITPKEADQTLKDLPDFQGAGWGGWKGPA